MISTDQPTRSDTSLGYRCDRCSLGTELTQTCGQCGQALCPGSGCYADWWALACVECTQVPIGQ
jgi:hypothetical protein